jgi:hypothetical protein
MDIFELMEDYLIDQEDGMKKLLTWFIDLFLGSPSQYSWTYSTNG